MDLEIKKCQNCKKEFEIDSDDFGFYEKMKVPPPTFCPECRHQRRLAIRNERVFYYRNCDSCGEKIISYYHPDKKQIVWCPSCWWSDKLDSLSFGRDFDFSKTFFEQFKNLYQKVPTLSLDIVNCKDSEYVSYCGDDNYCYFDIAGERNEYCYFCKFVKYSKDCLDCSFVYNSELNYECVNCHKIYGSTFLDKCQDCTNCHFMYDCKGCIDCFGCWNLRNQSYCIFNKNYSREEYKKIIFGLNKKSFSALVNFKKEFKEKSKGAIVRFATLINSQRSTGDDLYNCKNVKESFDVSNLENSKYLCDVLDAKECYDLDFSLYKPSFNIELISTLNLGNSGFCSASHYSHDIWYSDKCNSSSDLFGCVAVNKKKYCILNKEYSKEEYFELKEKIIEHMKKTGEWGQFFPIGTSGFGYNETVAQEYFFLTKEECHKKSLPWWDEIGGTYGKETIDMKLIPDNIDDITDDFIKEVLVCSCGRNYKIVPYELNLYKKLGLPIPRECPNCRHKKRNEIAGKRKLWHRKCMKENCENEFETSYEPKSPEIIYCEKCYQQEVY
ncbi:MAG: hypothetical protein WC662_00920 [Candidatus Paceibacterota bacterium]|jgi:hypothetical protein